MCEVVYVESGIMLNFESLWGEGELYVLLIGEFNVCNLLLVLVILFSLGFEKSVLFVIVLKLCLVLGWMELF